MQLSGLVDTKITNNRTWAPNIEPNNWLVDISSPWSHKQRKNQHLPRNQEQNSTTQVKCKRTKLRTD
jgi:hypothetical protein